MPRSAVDAHVAAEEQRALLHAEQPERLARVQLVVLDADAVVGHLQRRSARRSSASSMSTRVAREWRATLVRISWKMRNIGGRDVDVELRPRPAAWRGSGCRCASGIPSPASRPRRPGPCRRASRGAGRWRSCAPSAPWSRSARTSSRSSRCSGLSFRRLASQVTSIFRPVSTWPSSSWISRAMCARSSSRTEIRCAARRRSLSSGLAQALALAEQLDEHRDLRLQHLGHHRLHQVVDRADLVAAEHRGHLVGRGGEEDDRRRLASARARGSGARSRSRRCPACARRAGSPRSRSSARGAAPPRPTAPPSGSARACESSSCSANRLFGSSSTSRIFAFSSACLGAAARLRSCLRSLR